MQTNPLHQAFVYTTSFTQEVQSKPLNENTY